MNRSALLSAVAVAALLPFAPLQFAPAHAQEVQPRTSLPDDQGLETAPETAPQAETDTEAPEAEAQTEAPAAQVPEAPEAAATADADEPAAAVTGADTNGDAAASPTEEPAAELSDTAEDSQQDTAQEDSAPAGTGQGAAETDAAGEQDGTAAAEDEPAAEGATAPRDVSNAETRVPLPDGSRWDSFHGQKSAQKYSPLTQITAENVGQLEKVWEFHTGDMSDGSGELPASVWSATPVYANGMLYVGTPFYRVLALDPATGEEIWSFDSESTLEALTQPALKNRGVSYWESSNPQPGETCQKIVYLGTMDAQLFAMDADTGELCENFAEGGVLDVNQWNDTNDRWPLSLLQPPTIAGDHVIIGWAGKDWEWAEAPPGTVFSVNAQTGELEWTVHTLPEEVRQRTGTANVWTHMSVDEELGLVYLPVSSPSPNYWGGNRLEELPLATSTTAVDIETGEVVWSFQHVRHDVWDYDAGSAPTLVDITVDGEEIPALIQASKMGMLWVLDRRTGEPVWEVEEIEVPTDTDIEGDRLHPTQRIVTKPEPVLSLTEHPKVWWIADLISGGECSRIIDNARYEGIYTPLTAEGTGTLVYPATFGGQQWGGVAYDPVNQIAVVNTSRAVQMLKMYPREEYEQVATGSGNEQGFYPQTGSPYGFELYVPLNWLGMPCWEPPYGDIRAIDMTTGDTIWSRPIGSSQKYGFYMPESMGSPTIGAPAVTAGGVIFIGSTMDAKVRAFSLADGEELWEDKVMAPAVSNPAVYEHEGRQYVAFIAGGNTILKDQVGDQIAVYALPLD